MSEVLMKTVCHEWHLQQGARMAEFGGWDMPIQYSGIVAEHNAVRNNSGLFDIAHMGRLFFNGPDACRLLDHLLTNDVSQLQTGEVRYSLVTNRDGGILDDVLVYRLNDCYMLVVNASNRLKIVDWIEQHKEGFDVDITDATTERFMLAIQGPDALGLLNPLCDIDVGALAYYTVSRCQVSSADGIVSRTGYTGEDGFEVIVDNAAAIGLWTTLINAGAEPCGLGCRDTLRLEAAMPLYGHELDESIDPFTAGLGFAVKLNGEDFIGRNALVEAQGNADRRKRIGIELTGRRIAREDMELYDGETLIGKVTSGTFSPTLQKPIAMAYIDQPHPAVGSKIEVQIRQSRESATIVKLPFYKRR